MKCDTTEREMKTAVNFSTLLLPPYNTDSLLATFPTLTTVSLQFSSTLIWQGLEAGKIIKITKRAPVLNRTIGAVFVKHCVEFSFPFYMLFIAIEKVFDSVNQKCIICLKGIPE